MGLSSADSPPPTGLVFFLVGSYCVIAFVCLLAARFQIYELHADEVRWERNNSRIRKWAFAALGVNFFVNALMESSKLLTGSMGRYSPVDTVLGVAACLFIGVLSIRKAFGSKDIKTISQ
jgi:hypothetical protein